MDEREVMHSCEPSLDRASLPSPGGAASCRLRVDHASVLPPEHACGMDAGDLMHPCEPLCFSPPDADQKVHDAHEGEGGWVQSMQDREVSGEQLLVRTAPVECMEVTPNLKL